jgi:putative selenium metabolism hydrolase
VKGDPIETRRGPVARELGEELDDTSKQLVSFARSLVEIPSPSGSERRVSDRIEAELTALGYEDVEVDAYGNVVGRYGSGPPRLMFNGHIDHVDPAGMLDPYDARIVDGGLWGTSGLVLRGRGACDMKANVAAGAYAVAYLDTDQDLSGSYVFVADVQEETDAYEGLPMLLDHGLRADFGLSGESTGLDVAIGHRGKLQFDVRVDGRSSHASRPADGVNAVYKALPVVAAVEAEHAQLPRDPDFGPATMVVTRVESEPRGDVAVVPSSCTIRVDRRYVPAESPEDVEKRLRELVAEVCARHGIEASVALVNHYPLMATERDDPLVAAGTASVREVTGRAPQVKTWDFGVNATFMTSVGIPSIGIGPGSERWAHSPEEHVPIDQVVKASRIYANLLTRLCT